jgi:hypothetical protein
VTVFNAGARLTAARPPHEDNVVLTFRGGPDPDAPWIRIHATGTGDLRDKLRESHERILADMLSGKLDETGGRRDT